MALRVTTTTANGTVTAAALDECGKGQGLYANEWQIFRKEAADPTRRGAGNFKMTGDRPWYITKGPSGRRQCGWITGTPAISAPICPDSAVINVVALIFI